MKITFVDQRITNTKILVNVVLLLKLVPSRSSLCSLLASSQMEQEMGFVEIEITCEDEMGLTRAKTQNYQIND